MYKIQTDRPLGRNRKRNRERRAKNYLVFFESDCSSDRDFANISCKFKYSCKSVKAKKNFEMLK